MNKVYTFEELNGLNIGKYGDDDNVPTVGQTIFGRTITQVKLISAQDLVKLHLNKDTVEGNLVFSRHRTRPTLMWVVKLG